MYLTRGTAPETEIKMNNSDQRQLTVRSLVLGVIGSVIITMSSMYIALRLSSLPWPIIFVALASMFSLKLMGNTNLNEINVTHTAMSAGAMVSGGLAFTIPGIWIMMPEEKPSFPVILAISMGGTILGLIFTVFIRKYFVEEKKLEYPMGQAAADTLRAGDEGGQKAKTLFTALGITGVFTIFRDWLHKIPAAWMSKKAAAYGSSAGIWFSPMMIGVGFQLSGDFQQIGRMVRHLKDTGLYDDSYIIFCADHGDSQGCHNGMENKSGHMYDDTTKIPLMIKPPKGMAHTVTEALASTVDIYATVLDIAGYGEGYHQAGHSLLPLLADPEAAVRDYAVCECVSAFPLIGMQRMYRRGGFKYVFNCGGSDELYDLEHDPYEMENLVDDPAHGALLREMMDGLAQAMYHHGDDNAPWYCKVNHLGDWALE